ncbi:MaoC family dehydratase [Psychrobacter sp. I-STPA10]|uniref:MaoC family dehydratase n=1 Tax=Psychrobacter sp. I-STPA10 TaxID=2585769 RepID=UPI001E29CD65|nr:MaoC/PaaZ C-terminal domain-containing protein [Psychrobacter sp. I-STPA10]
MSDQHFKALPKVHTTYANIIKSLLPIGENSKVSKEQLPKSTYTVDTLHIDQENLTEYRKICGFVDDGNVPVTYFAVLSQALQMNMMVKEPFPFAVLGLVHVENSVTQYRPISQSEVVKLAVSFDNLRDHDKGQQFDFVTTVHVGDEKVWEGTSTYLSRQRTKKSKSRSKTLREKSKVPNGGINEVFEVPEDIGRRYAFVSGDFNLIHLHPLSAKAFGFPKAIAHGMWSKAKCLAKLKNLPDAYQASVSFKLPILLPAEVELIAEDGADLSDAHDIYFNLYSVKNDKPHLLGKISTAQSHDK